MKILSVTAQKPDSTGSGIYLTELVRGFKKRESPVVIAGVTKADQVCLPEGVSFYPVYFESEQLPYPITGMSDEMPYPSTRYSDLTEEMTEMFRNAFGEVLKKSSGGVGSGRDPVSPSVSPYSDCKRAVS